MRVCSPFLALLIYHYCGFNDRCPQIFVINKLQIFMFDFDQLGEQISPVVKKIKLEAINQLNEDESTRRLGEKLAEAPRKCAAGGEEAINFMSLRQRYSGLVQSDHYPLPRKFDNLLATMRSIEQNFWKKRKGLVFDFKKHCLEILQIGQLLKLDQELYQLNRTEKGIELRMGLAASENLPQYHHFQLQLPALLEARLTKVRSKLDAIVQKAHTEFLAAQSLEDFEEFSRKYKVYHPQFDLQSVRSVEPVQLQSQIFEEEEQTRFKSLVHHTIAYYHLRGVSFMFMPNLIDQLHLRLNLPKEEVESKIHVLTKCIPDFIQISNKLKEVMKQKWIVQINKSQREEQVIDLLNIYFF